MKEYTHDGRPLVKELRELNHRAPATLAGLAVCITGIVPGFKGYGAEHAAELAGARTTKNVSGITDLLVIGHNAGRDKISRAQAYGTPTITAREFLALI
jgi:BRCT domain type II-containing protein